MVEFWANRAPEAGTDLRRSKRALNGRGSLLTHTLKLLVVQNSAQAEEHSMRLGGEAKP